MTTNKNAGTQGHEMVLATASGTVHEPPTGLTLAAVL
jgi:hypothetical protein